jgi:hypothetical protein
MSGLPSAILVALLAVGVGVFVLSIDGIGGTESATSTHVPVADTYVDASQPGTTYGTNARIVADRTNREVLLRFDLSELSGPIRNATLRLHVANIGQARTFSGGRVDRVDDTTWSESGTSFENRPSIGAELVTLGEVSRTAWIEVPVTAAITTGGLLTLGIRAPSSDGVSFHSRESGTYAPQLLITSGTPPSTPSSPPVPS